MASPGTHEHTWRLDHDGEYWLHCDCGEALSARDLAEEYPSMQRRVLELEGTPTWMRVAEAMPPADRPLWLAILPDCGWPPVIRATLEYGTHVYRNDHGRILRSNVISHWMLDVPPAPPKEAQCP